MACNQILDHAAKTARVDGGGVELPGDVRPGQQTEQQHCEVGVLGVPALTLRQTVEHARDLGHDLGVELGETFAELWPPNRGDADLGEEDAAIAIGGKLDEEEVEPAREGALGVEHVELGAQRNAELGDHLIDGRDQQVFLRDEVVVHEAGGQIRFRGDALDGRFGDAVLENGGAQTFDDLAAARTRQTLPSHK